MKKIHILILMFCSTFGALCAEDAETILLFEDFTRFDAGTKPASYGGRAEIITENGKNILRLQKGDIINNIGYFDAGGSNYKIKIRIRFLEPGKKAGGLSIRFNDGGKRGDYPYEAYVMKLDAGAMGLPCIRGRKNKKNDPKVLKGVLFDGNGIKPLKENTWYNLELTVRPNNVEVMTDVSGKTEKLISGKINYGTGRYNISIDNPADIDYVKVTYLGGNDDDHEPKAENTAGATNATDQANAIDGK